MDPRPSPSSPPVAPPVAPAVPVVAVMAVVAVLAERVSNSVNWNGRSPADVTAGRSTPVDAAPFTFAIWGPIFVLHVVWVVFLLLPSNRRRPELRALIAPGVGVIVGGTVWPVLAAYGHHAVGLAVIVAMWVACSVVDVRSAGLVGQDAVCSRVGFLLERGWLTAAAALAAFAVAEHDAGFDGGPLGLTRTALVAVLALVAIGVVIALTRRESVSAAVLAWACFGIAADDGFVGVVATTSILSAAGLLGVALASAVLRRQARARPSPA